MRYMLLTRHNATETGAPPASEWKPAEWQAHLDCLDEINRTLTETGELVEVRGLAWPDTARIVSGISDGAPIVTDGPYPESTELLAGYQIIDVDDEKRALEIASWQAAAPGPGGTPINNRIEVRAMMGP